MSEFCPKQTQFYLSKAKINTSSLNSPIIYLSIYCQFPHKIKELFLFPRKVSHEYFQAKYEEKLNQEPILF